MPRRGARHDEVFPRVPSLLPQWSQVAPSRVFDVRRGRVGGRARSDSPDSWIQLDMKLIDSPAILVRIEACQISLLVVVQVGRVGGARLMLAFGLVFVTFGPRRSAASDPFVLGPDAILIRLIVGLRYETGILFSCRREKPFNIHSCIRIRIRIHRIFIISYYETHSNLSG